MTRIDWGNSCLRILENQGVALKYIFEFLDNFLLIYNFGGKNQVSLRNFRKNWISKILGKRRIPKKWNLSLENEM